MPRNYLTGKFGRWLVLGDAGSTGNTILYHCQCECGTQKIVRGCHLKSGASHSCGCFNREMVALKCKVHIPIGTRFGRLTILEDTGEQGSEKCALWLCLCDCGKQIKVSVHSLKKGNTRSCGCLQRDAVRRRATIHGLSHTRAYKLHIARAYQMRRAQRLPKWADLEAIKQIYLHCPKGHHVDHVIPLYGEKISGLHVHDNLQYLPGRENIQKKNRFEPRLERPDGTKCHMV